MSRKAIFFDIDGTIISEKTNIIPESAVTSIRRARENGHLIFVNTGRTFFNVTEDIRSIGFDGYICGCGTYIHYNGETLLEKSISDKKCLEIVKTLREYKVEALFEGKNDVYFDQTRPACGELTRIRNQFGIRGFDVTKSWDDPDIKFDKFVVWTNKESNVEAFFSYIKEEFDYIDRGDNFGEVIPKGYSKATGIEFFQRYFNISLKDCYAIGDSHNDLSMFKHVPNSIAMGNSPSSLFNLVSFITKDIEDDGIEYALKHYKII